MNAEQVIIGDDNLPTDLKWKLAEFCEFLDTKYETKNGTTALYWMLAYHISNELLHGKK